jgi:hypothetical protein
VLAVQMFLSALVQCPLRRGGVPPSIPLRRMDGERKREREKERERVRNDSLRRDPCSSLPATRTPLTAALGTVARGGAGQSIPLNLCANCIATTTIVFISGHARSTARGPVAASPFRIRSVSTSFISRSKISNPRWMSSSATS